VEESEGKSGFFENQKTGGKKKRRTVVNIRGGSTPGGECGVAIGASGDRRSATFSDLVKTS